MSRRTQITFTDRQHNFLLGESARCGLSMAELVRRAVDWARAQGAHKISLEMWPDNDAARALYEKFGFEQEGFLRDHYRRRNGELRSAVTMGLLLDGTTR